MNKGDFIFVYGTLRTGERMDLRKQQKDYNVRYCGKDKINGKLYHLGAYPGIKDVREGFDATKPIVFGEIYMALDNSIAAILDAYEGYYADNPATGLYDRKVVETEHGKHAWVYTYNPPVTSDQLIPNGDWCLTRELPMQMRALRR